MLRELDKDYGMFDNNKKMHMRNLDHELGLHDVVNFHEIITLQDHHYDKDVVPEDKSLTQAQEKRKRRPLTAKAASMTTRSNMSSNKGTVKARF